MSWAASIQHNIDGSWSMDSFGDTRIMGVLQRIALCYLFAALMIHFIASKRTIIIICILLLAGYWALLLIFGDPNNPYGMLTNAGTYLDKWLMGDAHLWHGEGVAFDPEGFLGTLPAIVNVICGYFAGKFIQEKGKGYETISKLLLAGFLFIFLALCWNMTFPIAKKLWTSPFVLLTVGIDMVWISALIYLVEKLSWNKNNWTKFFTVVGKNPLPIYIFSELLGGIVAWVYIGKMTPDEIFSVKVCQAIAPGALGSLLFAICYMLICWLFGKILDKNKIYLRV
jgi:predicted acyltransferase